MSSKVRRAAMGPSWTEVILGALLSALLGAVLGATLLVLRPVITAKEDPKEPVPGAVYFIEGTRDGNRGSAAAQKRAGFASGQSVSVNEDELNSLLAGGPTGGPARPPAGGKAKEADKAAEGWVSVGKANVRIRHGVLQVAAPITVNALDLGIKLTAQARGGFARRGDRFVFEPAELYLGSCPLQRIPVLGSLVGAMVASGISIPDDVQAAWARATQVAIDGATLRITMP